MEVIPKHGWKRALIICGLFLIYIFGIIVPWLYGWVRILEKFGILSSC